MGQGVSCADKVESGSAMLTPQPAIVLGLNMSILTVNIAKSSCSHIEGKDAVLAWKYSLCIYDASL